MGRILLWKLVGYNLRKVQFLTWIERDKIVVIDFAQIISVVKVVLGTHSQHLSPFSGKHKCFSFQDESI